MIIARQEDLVEVLRITKNMTNSNYSNLPSHKVKFLEEIFRPVYESKSSPDSKDDKTEKIISVTSKELCDFYKKRKSRGITTDNLKKQYLNELLVNDVIGEAQSEIDKRQLIYPLIDLRDENEANEGLLSTSTLEKITKLSNTDSFVNLLYVPQIKLSKNYKEIPQDWLIIHILGLVNYRIGLDKIKGCLADFLNTTDEFRLLEIRGNDENRLTIREFISKYESNPSISIRYIFKSQFYEFDSKFVGKMIGICVIDRNNYKKLSNRSPFDNFDISCTTIALPLLIPTPPSLPFIQSSSNQVANEEVRSIDHRTIHTETNVVLCTENDEKESYPPILSCSVCHEYSTDIEFDMALHIMEFHSKQLANHIYKAEGIELHAEFNDMVDYAIDMAKGILQSRTYSKCIYCDEYLLRNESTVHEHLVQFHKLDLDESLQQIRSDYPDEQDMNIEKMLQIVIDTVVYELPAQYMSY